MEQLRIAWASPINPPLLENPPSDHAPLISQGSLHLDITRDPKDIQQAQALRHRVFFEECAGQPAYDTNATAYDADEYDAYCDHVMVYHQEPGGPRQVVGTYRFLRPENMEQAGRFYTESEFDLQALLESGPKKRAEVGRSCVDPAYRNGHVIKLLWRGIATYMDQHALDMMFGCASFHGTDPLVHQEALSYLHHYHRMEESACPTPLPSCAASVPIIAKEALDKKRAFAALPPLIKGYVRLGARVGLGAVIDPHVQTIDVCIVLQRQHIAERYFHYFTLMQ